jgi:hypothetical protein
MGTACSRNDKIINSYRKCYLKHEGNRSLGKPKGRWGNAVNVLRFNYAHFTVCNGWVVSGPNRANAGKQESWCPAFFTCRR